MDEDKSPTQNIYPDLASANVHDTSSAEREEEAKKEEMRKQLEEVEDEIATLKQVLHAKEQHASELRKALGINTLSQLKAEINKVQSSQAYQSTQAKVAELNEKVTSSEYYKKTSETLKSAGQATASVFNTIGSSVSTKFSEMKNSPTFKSFEERVEGVGSSIMAKVSGTPKDGEPGSPKEGKESPVTRQPGHGDEVPM